LLEEWRTDSHILEMKWLYDFFLVVLGVRNA
jgi:hypothetical protein